MFKEWLKLFESSELQRDEFKKIVSKYFPESQFYATKDGMGIWTDIEYADRIVKLTWERGLPRLEKDYKNNKYKSHSEFDEVISNVYISVINKNTSDQKSAWSTATLLRSGSLSLIKKMKAMVQELTNSGMSIEYLPSDPKKSNFYKKTIKNMGMNRITGSNYWVKNMPHGLHRSLEPTLLQ